MHVRAVDLNSWLTVWSSDQDMEWIRQQAGCRGTAPILRTRCNWLLVNPQQSSQVRARLISSPTPWQITDKHVCSQACEHVLLLKNWTFSDNTGALATVSDVFGLRKCLKLWTENENAAECLQLLGQLKWKADVVESEKKFGGGFYAETILKIASWCPGHGPLLCECVCCMHVCECADMSQAGD